MLRNIVKGLKVGAGGVIRDENQYLCLIRDILNHGEEIKVEMVQQNQFWFCNAF